MPIHYLSGLFFRKRLSPHLWSARSSSKRLVGRPPLLIYSNIIHSTHNQLYSDSCPNIKLIYFSFYFRGFHYFLNCCMKISIEWYLDNKIKITDHQSAGFATHPGLHWTPFRCLSGFGQQQFKRRPLREHWSGSTAIRWAADHGTYRILFIKVEVHS